MTAGAELKKPVKRFRNKEWLLKPGRLWWRKRSDSGQTPNQKGDLTGVKENSGFGGLSKWTDGVACGDGEVCRRMSGSWDQESGFRCAKFQKFLRDTSVVMVNRIGSLSLEFRG